MLKKREEREIERQGEIEGDREREREEGSVLQGCNHLDEIGFASRISYCYYFFPTFSVLSPTVPHPYDNVHISPLFISLFHLSALPLPFFLPYLSCLPQQPSHVLFLFFWCKT